VVVTLSRREENILAAGVRNLIVFYAVRGRVAVWITVWITVWVAVWIQLS
jgi:hypothetical protein